MSLLPEPVAEAQVAKQKRDYLSNFISSVILILLFGLYPITGDREPAMAYIQKNHPKIYLLYLADLVLYLWYIVYSAFMRSYIKPSTNLKQVKIFELLQGIPYFIVGQIGFVALLSADLLKQREEEKFK